MGKLFWIGSGVGLLAAVGLWGAVTSGISGDVDSLYKKVDARRSELYQWATPGPGPKQRFDDIKNMSHINVEKTYQKGLQDTTAKLHGQMHARNLSLDPKVWEDNPPPMHEVSLFRAWLTEEYNKRNGKLSRAGIALPAETTGLGEVDDWDKFFDWLTLGARAGYEDRESNIAGRSYDNSFFMILLAFEYDMQDR